MDGSGNGRRPCPAWTGSRLWPPARHPHNHVGQDAVLLGRAGCAVGLPVGRWFPDPGPSEASTQEERQQRQRSSAGSFCGLLLEEVAADPLLSVAGPGLVPWSRVLAESRRHLCMAHGSWSRAKTRRGHSLGTGWSAPKSGSRSFVRCLDLMGTGLNSLRLWLWVYRDLENPWVLREYSFPVPKNLIPFSRVFL